MEQSMTPAGPPEPPGPEPVASEAATRRRAVWIALAVLVAAAIAVAAYFVGRSSANAPRAYDRGYARGREATEREFAPGTPRYQTIYNTGFRAGHTAGVKVGERAGAEKGTRVGLERGTGIGRLQGERRGIVSGANAALGGYARWQVGDYYIARLAPGGQGVRYRIVARKLMDTDRRYAICANNPGDVCSKPISGR